jgi:hypothetical protein
MNIYYVYQLIDPRTNLPFYIGQGKGNRAQSHMKFTSRCNNPHKDRTIRKIHRLGLEVIIQKVKEFLTKDEAVSLEMQMIREIGLAQLTNICEDANPPILLGKNNGFYGKTHTNENKILQGNGNRGQDLKTPAGKLAISAAMATQWADPAYRQERIAMLKSRKGEKRSQSAIGAYKVAAKARDESMTPEQRSGRAKKAAATRKLKYAGKVRKAYIDEDGSRRFKYVSAGN